jgi:hypothetical protein
MELEESTQPREDYPKEMKAALARLAWNTTLMYQVQPIQFIRTLDFRSQSLIELNM